MKGDSLVREEDVKQLKDVLRFFVQKSEAGRDEDPKQREEVQLTGYFKSYLFSSPFH